MLTLDLEEKHKRPYFLWDELLTVDELERFLRGENTEKRLLYIARILREARFEDVWKLISVEDVVRNWNQLQPWLGHKQAFWEFLLRKWRRHGLLPE
ncbi:hypothetical protein MYX84_13405 [Acidobacteria bacterium AH-259-O06]|nr:hypothetical protein [Acidobacteria bacterium AH-259-O06]